MDSVSIFVCIWFAIVILILTMFYISSKKALSIFPKLDINKIRFHEKFASGYIVDSYVASARGTLDIKVVENEIWTRTVLFSFPFLTFSIPIKNIYNFEKDRNKIIIDFTDETEDVIHLIIKINNKDEFMKVVSESEI